MQDFMFSVPQNIVFGKGSIKKLSSLVEKIGAKKLLVISGRNLEKVGTVQRITDILDKSGIEHEEFLDVEPNPSVETVNAAMAIYRNSKAEAIIALGGGSPMDVAKAVGILAAHGGEITQYEGSNLVPSKIVPVLAIPTTAGTGSETTAFAVITDKSRNYKFTVSSNELIPCYAVMDPELIMSLPAFVAASTGIDALVHAIEAYLSKVASPFTDAMAEKSMELIGKNIRRFVADRSNEEAACSMMMASNFAGIAFSWARLGNVHAMAHPLGGFFNVPHGVANAILMPVVLEYNALSDNGKYEKIYNLIKEGKTNTDFFTPDTLVHEIRRLIESLGIPGNLSSVGVTEDKIPLMASDAMKSGNIAVNPRVSIASDIEMLYKKAM
ncbi:iron-containing alcohol dehydrogenase [Acetivibrio cellulolyticus]|uniref:iron-containing alcohol dehydrogenase n=1 Tax=Acetivibrio cellulolyticus TaxID=35830 RepID=UPI0001E2E707|nr:iron-containing alcohol dehydrogenase [Acetivibrio cellulolyticus]